MYKFCLLVLALVAASQAHTFPRWSGRIVGGEDVDISQYPHQISMQYYGSHICGGTLIGGKYIVTAAHCTDGMSASALTVRVGSSTHNSGGEVISVGEIRQHPGYNSRTMSNDISILVLRSAPTMGRAAGLPDYYEIPSAGSQAVCTGWGYLWENGPMPTNLQGVVLPIVSQRECENAYYPANIDDTMICAGYPGVGGKDACQGDSGGPLVIGNKLVGVVSWGYGCADADYPGVFANVGTLRRFITEQTNI